MRCASRLLLQQLRRAHSQAARGSYARLEEADVSHLRSLLGADCVLTDAASLRRVNSDWLGQYHGRSSCVVQPSSTSGVQDVLRYATSRRLAVVPQGGNTGLCGGGVPVHDELVLSLRGLRKVHSVDAAAGVAVADAGVTLGELDAACAEHGLTVPLDIGSRSQCQLGGNVSTCAAGLRLIRYGSMRGNLLGLEVVLADGTLLDMLKSVRKDATGGDLSQLFCGSEGTLGVITKVSLVAPTRPTSAGVAWLACPSFEAVLATTRRARRMLGETLSACEFQDAEALSLVRSQLADVHSPPPSSATHYMLVECSTSASEAHMRGLLQSFVAAGAAAGEVLANGSFVPEGDLKTSVWRLRTGIAESFVRRGGFTYKYDLSFAQADMYSLVTEVRELLRPAGALVVGYGHVGDGNVHLNIGLPPGATEAEKEAATALLEPFVFQRVRDANGSVSAEHGIGQMKRQALAYGKSPAAIGVLRSLKTLFDPQGILNPYKVLPDVAAS